MFIKRAKELGIHRTVHAGEAGPAASVHEVWLEFTNVSGVDLEKMDLFIF